MKYRYEKKRMQWDNELPTWKEAVRMVEKDTEKRKKIYKIIRDIIDDCVGFSYAGQWWTAGKGKAHFHEYDKEEVRDIVKDKLTE